MYTAVFKIQPHDSQRRPFHRVYTSELGPQSLMKIIVHEIPSTVELLGSLRTPGDLSIITESHRLRNSYPKHWESTFFRPRIDESTKAKYAFCDYPSKEIFTVKSLIREENLAPPEKEQTSVDTSPMSHGLIKMGDRIQYLRAPNKMELDRIIEEEISQHGPFLKVMGTYHNLSVEDGFHIYNAFQLLAKGMSESILPFIVEFGKATDSVCDYVREAEIEIGEIDLVVHYYTLIRNTTIWPKKTMGWTYKLGGGRIRGAGSRQRPITHDEIVDALLYCTELFDEATARLRELKEQTNAFVVSYEDIRSLTNEAIKSSLIKHCEHITEWIPLSNIQS